MGINACIYVNTSDGKEPAVCDSLPQGCRVVAHEFFERATHEIDQGFRYYGPGYERGPWPSIAAVLMALYAAPNVEAVWYFGDCHDEGEPFTREQVLEFSEHYMTVGDRPYRNR